MSALHLPVMVREVLDLLPLRAGATAVDGTLGHAGHGVEIAKRISPGGLFVGIDWDSAMLEWAREKLAQVAEVETHLYVRDYRELAECLDDACKSAGRKPCADAILLDLGLNSAQIADAERGITFQEDGPLDMRFSSLAPEPASAFLNRASADQIARVLDLWGDERWSKRIAQVIVDRRKTSPLRRTSDLVDCVLAAIPAAKRDKRIHPATRTFQAVRIHINRELEGLESALTSAAMKLCPGGVLAVLSYHSGEDRAAKFAFRTLDEDQFDVLFKKPIEPSPEEVRANPRSRSAKLRAVRRKNEERP